MPEHRHPNEQCGIVIRGQVRFRIGDETRSIGPGGTWRILGNEPHEVHTGPEGATVIDAFAPIRSDWEAPAGRRHAGRSGADDLAGVMTPWVTGNRRPVGIVAGG